MKRKFSGFTILEMLVATGIAAVVMTSIISTISNLYREQKRIQLSQNYYTEARNLMERIAQIVRNNTIDYDRYFYEYGPPVLDCTSFDENQAPGTTPLLELVNNDGDPLINKANRVKLGHTNIFYWDTNDDVDGKQDRNLGGKKKDGTNDPCTQAWDSTTDITSLYLINGGRNLRTAIRKTLEPAGDDRYRRVEIERQLGADTDNDGQADLWGPSDINGNGTFDFSATGDVELVWDSTNSICELHYDVDDSTTIEASEEFPIIQNANDEDLCYKAHLYKEISLYQQEITDLHFYPAPHRDPYLNFRIDEVQSQPSVAISLGSKWREPKKFGFSERTFPKISFHTTVSSRVYGNTRK